MSHSSWLDYYSSKELWFEENVAAFDVINLLSLPSAEGCISNLIEHNNVVALTIDPITEELILFHHITRIGKSLKKKAKKNEKVVALSGFAPQASVVRFKSSEFLFHDDLIISAPTPDYDKIEQVESCKDFSKLKTDPTNKNVFRNIIILPPFAVSAILSTQKRDAASIALSILAAAQNVKDALKSHEEFEATDHRMATSYLISWLWLFQNDKFKPTPHGVMTDSEIDFWCTDTHKILLPSTPTVPEKSLVPSPSDITLSNLASNVNLLTSTLEKQHNEKSVKKCKFDSMETFSRKMVLNASSKSHSTSAVRPCSSFLEILNCPSASRSQTYLNHMLHRKEYKIEVPLAMVSHLISCDWVCRDEHPDKFSFMFFGANQSG